MCDVPRCACFVDGDSVDVKGLGDLYCHSMESAILADTTQLRKNHDAIRAGNRWLDAGAPYFEDNSPCLSHDAVGAALLGFWGPVFDIGSHDDDASARFLPFAMDFGRPDDWRWTRYTLRGLAEAAHSSPGLDGVGYSFWAHAPDAALEVLDIAEAAQESVNLQAAMHAGRSVFIPKAELVTGVA